MKIGLIDVDGHNFPSLPLMKLSAWHKQQGDTVEWYDHLQAWNQPPFDEVYMSKVFTASPDYPYTPNAEEIVKSGSGYITGELKEKFKAARKYVECWHDSGRFWDEVFSIEQDGYTYQDILSPDIEHTYPDYSLYPDLTKDIAYGFVTRGCPRGCDFCAVGDKEGKRSYKVANLSEFWSNQKNIVLLDPNITACPDWQELFGQLADSGAWVDFTQGLDIRLMTTEKAELLKRIKVKMVHFAWDNYKHRDIIVPKLKEFKDLTGWDCRKMTVYVLVNYNSTLEEDLERIYTIRDLGYWPYVMIYDKDKLPPGHQLKRLQRWVNMRAVFQSVPKFEDYIDK